MIALSKLFKTNVLSQLSDGLCDSTCALFMEMMHWDAGVKSVVVGGRPSYGPMQAPAGSRGARYYGLTEIDASVINVQTVETDAGLPPDPALPNRLDQDIFIYAAGVNLRDQIREEETVPLQMQFEAADCRIFYTPSTFNNFTNLWTYAADATWRNPQLCTQGSTGFATRKGSTPKPPPVASPLAAVHYNSIGVPILAHADANVPILISDTPLPDGSPNSINNGVGQRSINPSFNNPQQNKVHYVNDAYNQRNQAINAGVRHTTSQYTGAVSYTHLTLPTKRIV